MEYLTRLYCGQGGCMGKCHTSSSGLGATGMQGPCSVPLCTVPKGLADSILGAEPLPCLLGQAWPQSHHCLLDRGSGDPLPPTGHYGNCLP